jgi:hypothetical protein
VSPLLAAFGVSLVERAVIDAFCRAKEIPFAAAVRRNELGIQLGRVHSGLAGREPRELLPPRPLTRLMLRHTVGLADPLAADEQVDAPADGLPSSLADCIERYGLRRFKLKVSGGSGADRDRLERIQSILEDRTGGAYRATLDGNEQFADVAALRGFWEELAASPATSELARKIDYVEQPLPRGVTISDATRAELAAWPDRPRLVIDESDDSLDAVARAIEAGYDGGAFKSSKGVFKGIANACLVEALRRHGAGRTPIYSGEDSSTIGPVGLPADLAVVATLGIDEPERNGHHYLRAVPGLPAGVERGVIEVRSVVEAPFGVAWRCDFEEALESAGSVVAALPESA